MVPFPSTMGGRAVDDEPLGDLSTLLQHRFDPSPAAAASFRLARLDGGSADIIVDGSTPRLFIGSGPACDVRIQDPTISRRHVALEIVHRELHVIDLGSKNGTFVGDLRVADAFLRGGETLRIGSAAFRVDAGAPLDIELPLALGFGCMVGVSREMRQLYGICERIAASPIPAVIEGETGTGKEALARSLHDTGPRAEGPFVVFDCTASSSSLIESELFGHVKAPSRER
jgi:two-component system, NtrC family, response regulator HydG